VQAALAAEGLFVDVDASTNTLNKKVREAQMAQFNFILVLGEKEEAAGEVNVRTRDNVQQGSKPLADFVAQLRTLIAEHQ
jgi:threonyl-tRNA synthetase